VRTPWCEDGDGHPDEHFPEDQTCWGAANYAPLSLEPADVDQDGDPYPARIGALAHRPYNDAPVVHLHTELHGWKNIDTAAHLTAEELRRGIHETLNRIKSQPNKFTTSSDPARGSENVALRRIDHWDAEHKPLDPFDTKTPVLERDPGVAPQMTAAGKHIPQD